MESLLKTKSVVCWIKNDIEFKMAEQAPLNSDLHRLFDEKKYSEPVQDMEGELSRYCLLSLKNLGQTIDLKDKVLFANEPSLYGFIASFIVPNPDIAYWVSGNQMMETLSVYYFRRNLTCLQKYIINSRCCKLYKFIFFFILILNLFVFKKYSTMLKFESGISSYGRTKVLDVAKKMISPDSKIYNDLNVYIKENTIFTNLQFSFIQRIVLIILFFDALLFIILLLKLLIVYFFVLIFINILHLKITSLFAW